MMILSKVCIIYTDYYNMYLQAGLHGLGSGLVPLSI